MIDDFENYEGFNENFRTLIHAPIDIGHIDIGHAPIKQRNL